jgi:hypothetical protein
LELQGILVWADNETAVDLLGFDYLVDALVAVLTEPRLLPVTVGVSGDWGSGKSSLMGMTRARLEDGEDRSRYVCVWFSPWRFESYEDVKSALMAAVLAALRKRLGADDSRLERLTNSVKAFARLRARLLGRVAPVVGGAAAAMAGAPVEAGIAAGAAAGSMLPDGGTGEDAEAEAASITEFHQRFAELMDELEDVAALVVFVDDLDRCLPPTIVDTFEAIRLFLHVRKTAYVVAAHHRIVEAAIDSRYPANRQGDESLGRDYLEKMLQVSITIPPLSEPEVETFINLLLAELHTDEDQLGRLRAKAREQRDRDLLAVAMNYGIARDVLDQPPNGLEEAFGLGLRIAPILARGLRGNPRQVKRFLNTLRLRQRIVELRSADLDPGVLAKLTVLEELHGSDFDRLFRWQLAQEGQPVELAQSEALVRDGEGPKEITDEVRSWAEQDHVSAWLKLDPPLTGVPLGRYFYFFRDRLSPAAPAARLPVGLQELLARLQLSVTAQRRAAVEEAAALDPADLAALFDALLVRVAREPGSPAADSAIELAERAEALRDRLAATLSGVAPSSVPPAVPLKLIQRFGDGVPAINQVLDTWSKRNQRLAAAIKAARGS